MADTSIAVSGPARVMRSVCFMARASSTYPKNTLQCSAEETARQYAAFYGDIQGAATYITFVRSSNASYQIAGAFEADLRSFFSAPDTGTQVALVINGYDGLTTNRRTFVRWLDPYVRDRSIVLRVYFTEPREILGRTCQWIEIRPKAIISMILLSDDSLGTDTERHFLGCMDRIFALKQIISEASTELRSYTNHRNRHTKTKEDSPTSPPPEPLPIHPVTPGVSMATAPLQTSSRAMSNAELHSHTSRRNTHAKRKYRAPTSPPRHVQHILNRPMIFTNMDPEPLPTHPGVSMAIAPLQTSSTEMPNAYTYAGVPPTPNTGYSRRSYETMSQYPTVPMSRPILPAPSGSPTTVSPYPPYISSNSSAPMATAPFQATSMATSSVYNYPSMALPVNTGYNDQQFETIWSHPSTSIFAAASASPSTVAFQPPRLSPTPTSGYRDRPLDPVLSPPRNSAYVFTTPSHLPTLVTSSVTGPTAKSKIVKVKSRRAASKTAAAPARTTTHVAAPSTTSSTVNSRFSEDNDSPPAAILGQPYPCRYPSCTRRFKTSWGRNIHQTKSHPEHNFALGILADLPFAQNEPDLPFGDKPYYT